MAKASLFGLTSLHRKRSTGRSGAVAVNEIPFHLVNLFFLFPRRSVTRYDSVGGGPAGSGAVLLRTRVVVALL